MRPMSYTSRIITYVVDGKRYFTVAYVFYDEAITPILAVRKEFAPECNTLDELWLDCAASRRWFDYPVLDRDNFLKVYNND